jgi:hypothetical protein
MARPAVAAVAMGGLLWYAQGIVWYWRAGLGAVLYVAILLVLGEPEVRAWMKKVLRQS